MKESSTRRWRAGAAFESRRDTAILRMFLDNEPSLTELASVRVSDVNLDGQLVRVRSKGGDEDLVPFGVTTARDLDLRWSSTV